MCVSCNKFAILIFPSSPDPPLVSLRLGSTLIVDDIKEGDDLYMECQIQANPKFSKMYWMHDVSMMMEIMMDRLYRYYIKREIKCLNGRKLWNWFLVFLLNIL